MLDSQWLQKNSPAFRLMIATSWLAPDSWQKNQEEAIREAIAARPDWTEYLRLVDRHRTPALSWAALKRVPGVEIPKLCGGGTAAAQRCLPDAGHAPLFAPGQRTEGFQPRRNPCDAPERAYSLLAIFTETLASGTLLTWTWRSCPSDLSRAQSCLIDLGWQLDSSYGPMTPGQWEKIWKTEQHLGFIDPQGECPLEIHWRNIMGAVGPARCQ
jgi:hypothetical protein